MVVCPHFHWNHRIDQVKYGQAYYLLQKISEFLNNNKIDLDEVPMLICGDLNSSPNDSAVQHLMGVEYRITPKMMSPDTGHPAY